MTLRIQKIKYPFDHGQWLALSDNFYKCTVPPTNFYCGLIFKMNPNKSAEIVIFWRLIFGPDF
jgi:hypothetical protein